MHHQILSKDGNGNGVVQKKRIIMVQFCMNKFTFKYAYIEKYEK